jgi:hypothetical protein
MSTVSGLSGFSSMLNPYFSAGQTRFTVSSFEGSFASVSGVTSGLGSVDSSSSASPVTATETYAPEVSTDGGDSSTPGTVTDVSSPSVSSQDQSDMLQALIASQSRGDQVAAADGGDFGVDDGLSANDLSVVDASGNSNDPYAAGALNAYSANSSEFSPSAGTGVSAWA